MSTFQYAQLWAMLKGGNTLRLRVHRSYLASVKRMISKTKDMDKAYKLLNPERAILSYTVTACTDAPLEVTLTVTLRQHPTNYTALLED